MDLAGRDADAAALIMEFASAIALALANLVIANSMPPEPAVTEVGPQPLVAPAAAAPGKKG
jgi:hypothetical protein